MKVIQDEGTKGITVSLPARDVDALRETARREDRSVSSIIRRALRELAERQESGDGSAESA